MRDFRVLPRFKYSLLSSGMLCRFYCYLPKFRDNISVPFRGSSLILEYEIDGLTETSVINYQSTLRKIQEERRSKNSNINLYVVMHITETIVKTVSHMRLYYDWGEDGGGLGFSACCILVFSLGAVFYLLQFQSPTDSETPQTKGR